MRISRGRAGDLPSEARTQNFTGTVWADPVLAETEGVTINNVFFTPGARTHWHSHERGQVLHVLAGQGFACLRDGRRAEIRSGDVVFFEPGEEHWHGAGESSYLLHLAISLGGHDWLDAVSDEEYRGSAA
jgi:quercetin dioxygenase-like cupin family protein